MATNWNTIDQDSRLSVCDLLSTALSAYVDNISDSHGNCVWDLSCEFNGKTCSIEIKDRSFPHDKFGDIFAEDTKQKYTAQNYSFQASLALNVFTDGVIAMANLYDKRAKHFKRWCPRTTLVEEDDHTYVQKDCLSLPQAVKFKHIDGTWRQI